MKLDVDKTQKAEKVFESRGLNNQETTVERIKTLASYLWDALDKITIPEGNTEAARLVSLAKTDLESSVMWGVKALSRNH